MASTVLCGRRSIRLSIGSLLHFSSDAFTVTTLHRYLIIFAASILVLALMRRLLPADIAWLATAWWVVLPINFNTLYEVHLFAVIPILWVAFRLSKRPSHWCRGEALACMLAASLLLRNELVLATGMLAAMFLGAALWSRRSGHVDWRPRFGVLAAYLVPLAGAGLLTFYYCCHASDLSTLSAVLERKHTLNICQIYAFGYQQRHTDFQKSPWTDCQELMTRTYGKPQPSLAEALRRNPQAMMEHFLWNVRLIPYGLQVLLFNVSSGSVTPDYVPVRTSKLAWIFSGVVLLVAAAGLIRLLRDRRYWWGKWLRERAWGWLFLGTVALVTGGVMVSQRPRPSYMLVFGILLRAAAAMLFFVLIEHTRYRRRLALAYPVLALAAVLCVPSYYALANPSGEQTLRSGYERLREFRSLLERPGTVLVTPGYGGELCNYVGLGKCMGLNYYDLRTEVTQQRNWLKVLDAHAAGLVYISEAAFGEASGRELAAELSPAWVRLFPRSESGGHWMLFANPARVALPGEAAPAPGR